MNLESVFLFDLDRTIIDSDHRTPNSANGDLDLNAYRKMQVHDRIMQDKLLPLADEFKKLKKKKGCYVAIVTARRLTKSDYFFLRKHGLRADLICSRDQLFKRFDLPLAELIYGLPDRDYKRSWFHFIMSKFKHLEPNRFTVFDDHQGVLEEAIKIGFNAYDAIPYNKMLIDLKSAING